MASISAVTGLPRTRKTRTPWAVRVARVVLLARRARRPVLVTAGLGMLTAAAWAVALPLGLLAAGLSLLLLDLLAGDQ